MVIGSALALVLLVSALARADVAANGASVEGTVTNGGQPVVNAKVNVFKAGQKKSAAVGEAVAGEKAKKHKPEPLMSVTTDGSGAFSLASLPAGEYLIVVKEKGVGHGKQKFTVVEGQSMKVTITMTAKSGHGKKAKGTA